MTVGYRGNVARRYDALYAAAGVDVAAEAAEVLARARALLGREEVVSLLDVACGTGAHLDRWRRTIVDLAGIDLSSAMLREARRRLPMDVALHAADFRTFDLGRTFEVVTCLFSSIGYVRDLLELDAAVARMAAHLAPGGVLLLEPWLTPDAWDPDHGLDIDVVPGDRGPEAVRVLRSWREGDASWFDWVTVEAGARGLQVDREEHRTLLITRERYLAAFTAAGLDATWEDPGLRGRGLVVARRRRDDAATVSTDEDH